MKKSIGNVARLLGKQELKGLKGGWGDNEIGINCIIGPCWYYEANTGWVGGRCEANSNNQCVCNAKSSSIVAYGCVAGGGTVGGGIPE